MQDMVVVMGAEVPSGRSVAKKLRMAHYAVRLVNSTIPLEEVRALSPSGLILAGEASEGAMPPDAGLLSLGLPVLALGSSAHALIEALSTECQGPPVSEKVMPVTYKDNILFEGLDMEERMVARAEHYAVPDGYHAIAESGGLPLAFCCDSARVFLLQFQIERNDPNGISMLMSFVQNVCGCSPWWTIEAIVQSAEKTLLKAVGDGKAICAMSGGLDSTVAAMLAKRALGDRVYCVFVDTGLMREGETQTIEKHFSEELRLPFARVDASDGVMRALRGLTGAQEKNRVIDREIRKALLLQAERVSGETVFVKGTHYVDVLGKDTLSEEGAYGPVVEPLRELFKDEIRSIGEYLGLPPDILNRQPFPGTGLAARIHGEVSEARLLTLRRATAAFSDALKEAGLMKRLSQCFALLDTIDGQDAIILRAVQGTEPNMSVARLPYDTLERVCKEITQALPSVSRILYDMSPGNAEWV